MHRPRICSDTVTNMPNFSKVIIVPCGEGMQKGKKTIKEWKGKTKWEKCYILKKDQANEGKGKGREGKENREKKGMSGPLSTAISCYA